MKTRSQVKRKKPAAVMPDGSKFKGRVIIHVAEAPDTRFPGPEAENDVDILQRLTNELISNPTLQGVTALDDQLAKTQNASTCDVRPIPAAWAQAYTVANAAGEYLAAVRRWNKHYAEQPSLMALGKYAEE